MVDGSSIRDLDLTSEHNDQKPGQSAGYLDSRSPAEQAEGSTYSGVRRGPDWRANIFRRYPLPFGIVL